MAARAVNPRVPRDLEVISLKCLEKEPARRYATAQALADDLEGFLADEPIHARPVSRAEKTWRWCKRKPALTTSFLLILILLLIVLIGSPIAAYRINVARKSEQAEALAARKNLYAADMNLAAQALDSGNLARAIELLEKYRPFNSPSPRSSRREEAHSEVRKAERGMGNDSQSLLTSRPPRAFPRRRRRASNLAR